MIRKDIFIPIVGIFVGELLMFFNLQTFGFFIYNLNLLLIIFMILLLTLETEMKLYLQGLTIIMLLRIVNFSMPYSDKMLIYGIMILPIYFAFKNQKFTYKELGIDFKKIIYIPIFIIIIYLILSILSNYMKSNITFLTVIYISIEMFLIVGTMEEFIFRSILQNRIENILDGKFGIIISGLIFGMIHSNYGMIKEIFFSCLFGISIGYIFYKTRDLFLVISLHGSANVFLFGIFPLSSMGTISIDKILLNGEIMSFFLIILLVIWFVISNTKYWNKCILRIFEMSIYPLLFTFLSIILYKLFNIIR